MLSRAVARRPSGLTSSFRRTPCSPCPARRRRAGLCCSTPGFAPPADTGSLKGTALKQKIETQDKLISAFQNKPQAEWRKLLAFSKKWPELADGVLDRAEDLIKQEQDPERKLKLRRFRRALKSASDETLVFRAMLQTLETTADEELEALVISRRAEITPQFFQYLQHVIGSYADDRAKQDELVSLGSRVAALKSAYERTEQDDAALAAAQEKFQDLLKVESLEEAEKKIDTMADSGELDPAFLLTMAQAYSGVKETDYTRDDVKQLMAHLYMKAKEATARQAPPEVRILKHLLSIEDPAHRKSQMEDAFKPGPDVSTEKEDTLSTTPQRLTAAVTTVLQAYETQKGGTTMLGQTADMMDPTVISRLREIQADLEGNYR